MTAADLAIYDCVVLSGGGARGAYGAGAAKALEVYRTHREIDRPVCYIGTSAGALNAYILASDGADALVAFWRNVSNLSILGTRARASGARLLWRSLFRRPSVPFSIYDNDALAGLIGRTARLADLKSPLIITATDYKAGSLKAFYTSEIVQRVVEDDARQSVRGQRFGHLRRIDTDDVLVRALLASAAIPAFFPPVEIEVEHNGDIEKSWYVDGGVGNNTPTREAAYFFRYIKKLGLGLEGTLFCVTLDAPRVFLQHTPFSLLDIIRRTSDVYQYVHTTPIIQAWPRINYEVDNQKRRVTEFSQWLDGNEQVSATDRDAIRAYAEETFGKLGGQAPRISSPFILVEPSSSLGDPFDFDGALAEALIVRGYNETITALHQTTDPNTGAPYLDEAEQRRLVNRPIW